MDNSLLQFEAFMAMEKHQRTALRCPHCRHQGMFIHQPGARDVSDSLGRSAGVRLCPNEQCKGIVFVILERGQDRPVLVFPAETVDFDATNLPAEVLASLEEAVQCAAVGCYRAAAIMVRRTLEEVCDERGATGKDLKVRIAALGTKALLPAELLSGLDALRVLGNDAAHLEAKVFNDVGQREVTVGLEVAKTILKAVYQYGALVAELEALKTELEP